MIRIAKPEQVPEILSTKGLELTHSCCAAFDASPGDYLSGKTAFEFDAAVYARVKEFLFKAQHKKCCYCEISFSASSYGDVDHYRPKGAVRQHPTVPEQQPGYYWLAYDWGNLLVSCEVCNRSHKKTLFPLSNPEVRARCHADDLAKEKPLLVNPAVNDPRSHIRFRNEAPEHLDEIGRITIETLGLRRASLDEARRTNLFRVKEVISLIQTFDKDHLRNEGFRELADKARGFLAKAVRPEAEFSSMAQDFISGFDLSGPAAIA